MIAYSKGLKQLRHNIGDIFTVKDDITPAAAVIVATELAVRLFCPESATPFTSRMMTIAYCMRSTASSSSSAA
jgi:hypothetical protein